MEKDKDVTKLLKANEYVFSFIEKLEQAFPQLIPVKGFDVKSASFDDSNNLTAIQFELNVISDIINVSLFKRLQLELDVILIAVSGGKITFRKYCF